ncbi:MAG: alkaline phosphatase [bacterium]
MLKVSKSCFAISMVLFLMVSIISINVQAQVDYDGSIPKYVFMFIGDGMSSSQVIAAEMYLGNKKNSEAIETSRLNFSNFPVTGQSQTYDATSFIPDSASTATSLASGIKTLSGVINMKVNKTDKVIPITEDLKKRGYKIGVISSVPINHATPAAYYAKISSRNNYYEIGKQLVESGFDYFGGGDFNHPKGSNGDQKHIYDIAQDHGYQIANTKEDILNLNSKSGKTIAINSTLDGTAMDFELDRTPDELALADFVRKGIDVLDNSRGYFMMVESGKIDWAGHANNAAASIHDTIAFADAIDEALKVYNKYPEDTLIVITGDHECGGMSVGFAGTGYSTFFNAIDNVSMSHVGFNKIFSEYKDKTDSSKAKLEHLLPQIRIAYGLVTPSDSNADSYPEGVLTNSEISRLRAALKQSMIPSNERNYTDREKIMYGGYEPLTITLTHIANNKAGLNYSSFSHTGVPVPVYALGSGAESFNGFYDNTDVYHKLCSIMGIESLNNTSSSNEKVAVNN